MNTTPYSVVTESTTLTTVTITRKQLWDNYIDCWKDVIWDSPDLGFDAIKSVASVLLSCEDLDLDDLRQLFRDGETVLLMGDAMQFIDNDLNNDLILIQIIVMDNDNKQHIVPHCDINF
jgi:hypothetical protein